MTRTQLKAYNNTWFKNWLGGKAITGLIGNVMNNYLIDYCVNKNDDNSFLGLFTYDSTRVYVVGQGVLYGGSLYICNTNTTGVWDATKWDIVLPASRDEFTFTEADIGAKMTLISGFIYQRTHNLNTWTPKFRLTRPNGSTFTDKDLDLKIISANIIQLDFGFEIDTGTSYVLIEK